MADRRRFLLVGLTIAVVAAAGVATFASSRDVPITGTVLDLTGKPIAGATVSMAKRATTSDTAGNFSLTGGGREGWVRADAAGYLPRLRPAIEGHRLILRLTPDDGHTISLVFGGDVMFGRRFFDPNEDGDPTDGQLQLTSTAADHARLLRGVAAPLAAADLSVVNLETPLLPQPFIDPTKPRPATFHPAKEFVFASLPASAEALRDVGIDVVGIGNNHLYDALDPGVAQTMTALDRAGFEAGSGRTGGGRSEDEAWTPAYASVRGTTVAIVACTTIDGHETPPLYVASGAAKGGAAACSEDGIRRAISTAKTRASVVVLMIHGGYEYVRSETERIQRLSDVAHQAGATLVVNHHPHVVGGFAWDAFGLTAWTIGNLLFDQTVWPTFESYLLTVHVRDGKPIRAMVDPLVMDSFQPMPIVGDLAEHVARDAAGWAPGPFVVEDGSVEIGDPGAITTMSKTVAIDGAAGGSILHLPGATSLVGGSVQGTLEAGRDLLWTGGFEDDEADGKMDSAPLWLAGDRARRVLADAAASGNAGVRLDRTGANTDDVILEPTHRVPVVAGSRLSFVFVFRRSGADSSTRVQLSWFNGLRGESSVRTVVDLQPGSGWQRFRIDVTVPSNAVAVLPIIRLGPPAAGQALLDVDDVRLIEWRPASDANLATDYVRVEGAATFETVVAELPGSTEMPGTPILISDGPVSPELEPSPLPPGPSFAPEGDE